MPEMPPLDRQLRTFAVELHSLAYTMPNGFEFELLRLAGRMTHAADAALTQRITPG